MRKAEVFIALEIVNPKETDEKLRRVKVFPKHGRGRSFHPVEIMSYDKMAYLAGYGIPQHYRDHAHPAPETAEEPVQNTPTPVPVMPSPREEPKKTIRSSQPLKSWSKMGGPRIRTRMRRTKPYFSNS